MVNRWRFFWCLVCFLSMFSALKGALPLRSAAEAGMNGTTLANIDRVVDEAIAHEFMPGAVVLVGHKGRIVYHKAFGIKRAEPTLAPMLLDTLFDVASLTKPVVTAVLVMKLVEQGYVCLSDSIALYLPAFDVPDKKMITIQQLLTHRAGFPAELAIAPCGEGKEKVLQFLVHQKLAYLPGSSYIYTCQGFFVLQLLVEKMLGIPLDVAAHRLIFQPLHMNDTCFCPQSVLFDRIAPTQCVDGTLLQGIVHDPAARALGGVSGNAGLFTTAADLAIFCQMMLNGGIYQDVRILSPASVRRMTLVGDTPFDCARGLGWEINSPRAFVARGELFPVGTSYGHTGFTGVSLWLDPTSQTFVIFLSSRLYPDGKGNLQNLRSKIATIVAASVMTE